MSAAARRASSSGALATAAYRSAGRAGRKAKYRAAAMPSSTASRAAAFSGGRVCQGPAWTAFLPFFLFPFSAAGGLAVGLVDALLGRVRAVAAAGLRHVQAGALAGERVLLHLGQHPRHPRGVHRPVVRSFATSWRIRASSLPGRSGTSLPSRGGRSLTCLRNMSTVESAVNGLRPVSSSKKTMPSEYRSDLFVRFFSPRHCSGDMYAAVPMVLFAPVRAVTSASLAMPKSVSFSDAVPRQHQVGRLQVAVDDPLLVGVLEGLAELPAVGGHVLPGEAAAAGEHRGRGPRRRCTPWR